MSSDDRIRWTLEQEFAGGSVSQQPGNGEREFQQGEITQSTPEGQVNLDSSGTWQKNNPLCPKSALYHHKLPLRHPVSVSYQQNWSL